MPDRTDREIAKNAEQAALEAYMLARDNEKRITGLAALLALMVQQGPGPEPEEAEPPLEGYPTTVEHIYLHGDGAVVNFGVTDRDIGGELSFPGAEPWMREGKRVLIYVQGIAEV